jgi:hypothetical protein
MHFTKLVSLNGGLNQNSQRKQQTCCKSHNVVLNIHRYKQDKLALHFRISVENAFLDEKEDACCALGELAGNAG